MIARAKITTIPIIDQEAILVAVNTLVEQKAIPGLLDHEMAMFVNLVSETDRTVELLQERRTAWIFAAVTGKVDVRGSQKRFYDNSAYAQEME